MMWKSGLVIQVDEDDDDGGGVVTMMMMMMVVVVLMMVVMMLMMMIMMMMFGMTWRILIITKKIQILHQSSDLLVSSSPGWRGPPAE